MVKEVTIREDKNTQRKIYEVDLPLEELSDMKRRISILKKIANDITE